MMGGRIGMHSQPDQGSTFWFEVPLREGNFCTLDRWTSITGRRVLIIDDLPLDRSILRRQLERYDLRLEEAGSPLQALDLLRGGLAAGQPFDFALVDYHMPEMDGIQLGRQILADPDLKATHLILITALQDRKFGREALAAGFRGYLTKPVKLSLLIETMQGAGRPTAASPAAGNSRDPANAAGIRILVAEDNSVNQRLMMKVLAKLGHTPEIVADGRQAVEAAARTSYGVILMDCQMPEMDGFEATLEIRRREDPSRRVPIIALTANAMKGDYERCIAAGMDDYLAKPVRVEALRQLLARYLPRPTAALQPA
jgi:CheY-like chemotaxis protein